MLSRKGFNRSLSKKINISRHAVKRAVQRGDFGSGKPSHTHARALSYLKKQLVSSGTLVDGCIDNHGERMEPKGKTQLISYDGWVGVLRPIYGQKALKLVTVYKEGSSNVHSA